MLPVIFLNAVQRMIGAKNQLLKLHVIISDHHIMD